MLAKGSVMKITINGKIHNTSENTLLSNLLQELNMASRALAVAINSKIIPRSQFDVTVLQEEDSVELVQAVGGG